MGLDLCFYKKSEYDKYEKDRVESDRYIELPEEIAYGRKTWSLVNFFNDEEIYGEDERGNYDRVISKQAWLSFFNLLMSYQPILKSLYNIKGRELTETEELMAETIYNVIDPDGVPYLGADWDCYAFYRILEKAADILKIYDSGDSIVMIASY